MKVLSFAGIKMIANDPSKYFNDLGREFYKKTGL